MVRACAVVIALVAACGGADGARLQHASAPISTTDPATIRGLLARYAPSGHAIVTAYEALPGTFELPDGKYETSSSGTFDGYLRDGAQDVLVMYTSTAVHEITHGYTSAMAFRLLEERQLARGIGAQAILADGEPTLVLLTATFPSLDMDATFPADAHTSRYPVYVAQVDQPTHGTQSQGIYGLLDEFAASYQDARVTLGFWPWVRDEAPADARVIMNYAVLLDDVTRGYDEFTLYILHYLVHAKAHRPEVYDAIVANAAFRSAFLDVYDRYTALVASVAELEPTVHAFASTRGVILERRGVQLLIDGNPQRSDDAAAMAATRAYLDGAPYRDVLANLRER